MSELVTADIAVVGGGFYGALVAAEIKACRPGLDVLLLEREAALFTRAASTNQGQFHLGYMYSADPELARECADNAQQFAESFGEAIDQEVISYYGIHRDSDICADDYADFCSKVGLPLKMVPRASSVFGEAVPVSFAGVEKTFNSAVIQRILERRLASAGVRLACGFHANRIEVRAHGVDVVSPDKVVQAGMAFNATFADINSLHTRSALSSIPLRHDTFLHFLLELPQEWKSVAATVIRGAFASVMPSVFRDSHILASGKFRRMQSALNDKPSEDITAETVQDVYAKALQDAGHYLPMLAQARYRGYTIGTRSAYDAPDGAGYTSKALVFENFDGIPDYHVVLGGKVGCMPDVLPQIRRLVA